MTLAATEFLRRFLLHVFPHGFMRIRHCGLTANCQREKKLARCRALLAASAASPPEPTPVPADTTERSHNLARQPAPCPVRGGRLRIVEILAPQPYDTS